MSVEVELIQSVVEARRHSPVVSRLVTESDLTGMSGAVLEVKPDEAAVMNGRVLSAGRHPVRGWGARRLPVIQRLNTTELALSAHIAGALAGGAEGELLDGEVRYGVRIADAARFVSAVNPGAPELRALDLARVLEPRVQAALAPLLRQYAAPDLIGAGLAAEKLAGAFRSVLAAALAELGLALAWAHVPALYCAEDAVLKAERALALRQRLRQMELDDQMDQLQKQAELEDFRRQLRDELGAVVETDATRADVARMLNERVAALGNHLVAQVEQHAMPPGYFARWLTDKNKNAAPLAPAEWQRADTLLRQQVTQELARVESLLREARSRVYRAGQTELALRLKEVERQLETARAELASIQPAYLNHPPQSWTQAQRALAGDDTMLSYAQVLAETAQEAYNRALAGSASEVQWAALETQLATVRHQWANRARLTV